MQNFLKSVAPLRSLIDYLSDTQKQYFLICGSKKSGKKTLIHYLLGEQLQYGIDDEGQDVLNIINQVNDKIVVLENIVELYQFNTEDSIRYIWFSGFPDQGMQEQDKMMWVIGLETIVNLLGRLKFQIILTFSLLEDLPSIINSYHKYFGFLKNFYQRTTIVLTKIIDEDQYNEFVQQNTKQIIEVNPKLAFIKQIVEKERVHCFFSREVDPDERQELINKLSLANQDAEELAKFQIQFHISQVYSKQWAHNGKQWEQVSKECLHKIYTFIDSLIITILERCCESEAGVKKLEQIQNSYKTITQRQQKFNYNNKMFQQAELSITLKIYEILYQLLGEKQEEFLHRLHDELKTFFRCFDSEQVYFITNNTIKLFLTIHSAISNEIDSDQQSFENIFIKSSFSSAQLKKLMPKFKQKFSESIVKSLEQVSKKSIKKQKKVKKLNFPDYQTQKKEYTGTIQDKLQLPTSPLKFQFLLDELWASSNQLDKDKSNTAKILKQKILIKNILKILQLYELYEQAMMLSSVVPDFNSIQINLQSFIQKISETSECSSQSLQILQEIISFCLLNRRRYIIDQAIIFVKNKKYQKEQQKKIDKMYEDFEDQGQKSNDSAFMNYQRLKNFYSIRHQIVEKMINEEYKNWKRIQFDLCLQEILKGDFMTS